MFTLAIFSILLVAALAYVNTKIVEDNYKTGLRKRVEQKISLVEPQLRRALASRKAERIEAVLGNLVSDGSVAGAEIRIDGTAEPIAVQMHPGERTLLETERAVSAGGTKALLTVRVSDREFRAMMQQYLYFLGAIVAGYLFLILILMRLVHRAFLPLEELSRKLEAFDPGHPVPIELEDAGRNEIGRIAAAASKMSDNIIHHADYMNELHEKIKEGQRHLKEAQQIARLGSWRVDPRTYECEFSDQMYVLLGLDPEGPPMQWQDFVDAIEEKDRRFFVRAVENTVRKHTPFRLMHQLHNRSGERLHVLTEGKLSERTDGTQIVSGISMDVSEQAESQRMIEKLAFYDPLTNLPNRLLFNDRLEKAIKDARRRSEKVGVFFLDLDRFKNVNDTLGHTMGDLLLKEVAQRLRRSLRESDTISRIGGDEFIVIAPMLGGEPDAMVVARKLLAAMQERWELGDKSLFTTTSIGVAIYPDHAQDVDTLVKFADTAMYKAKEEGRNKIKIYNLSMGEKIEKKLKIEHEMREAIETMEQFELYYQPKISLRSGAIVGAEVLIRWNHPELGLVFPDDFIPIAESTGMIIAIGEWVMHDAARQIEKWKQEGVVPLKLAVNLSGRQFQSPTLLEHIRTVLDRYDIRPQYLEFEVTESVSMISLQESLKVLHQLSDLGVGVVIDDFGTGYSSLAYLKQFPVDTLKIDKAFIMNMLEDHDDRVIVESIVSMSKAMDLKIVAEGVETIEHVHLLKKLGVDFGQGYFFSRPIPIEKFDLMYRKNLIRMKERREAQREKKEEG